MKVTRFDRATHRLFAEEMLSAAQAVATKFGVSVTLGRGMYSNGSTATVKLEAATLDSNGVAQTTERSMFPLLAGEIGLTPDQLGAIFLFKGKSYKVDGVNPRSQKFPVEATRLFDGKRFRFPASTVAKALEQAAAAS